MTAFTTFERSNHVPALTGTVVFHAVLLSIFFVAMAKLSEPIAPMASEGLALHYGLPLTSNRAVVSELQTVTTNPSTALPPSASPTIAASAVATTTHSELEETVVAALAVSQESASADSPAKSLPAASTSGSALSEGVTGTDTGLAGQLNALALYESAATGLKMPGWRWVTKPQPTDASSATGTLVFEIRVDENGEVQSIRKMAAQSTFNDPIAERAYLTAIEQTEFEPIPAAGTGRSAVGYIIFRIGAK
jgi:hypothetical protein